MLQKSTFEAFSCKSRAAPTDDVVRRRADFLQCSNRLVFLRGFARCLLPATHAHGCCSTSLEVLRRAKPRAFRSRKCSESRPPEVENHGAATKNIARQPGSRPRKKQAREEPSRDRPQGPRGSGSAPRLPSWGCAGTAGCPAASGGRVLRPTRGSSSPRRCPRKVTNAPINPNLASSSKTDLETCGKNRELKRKLSERALTQRKARAREEPSPGPPASETDAGPPGHQPRGGAPARPRLSRGQEGPT